MDKLDMWIFIVTIAAGSPVDPPLGVGTVHKDVAACFREGRAMIQYPEFSYLGHCVRVRHAMEVYPDMRWL